MHKNCLCKQYESIVNLICFKKEMLIKENITNREIEHAERLKEGAITCSYSYRNIVML